MANPYKYQPPEDKYCPLCDIGNIRSHNIKICWRCQEELMPEEDQEPYYDGDIKDYSGFVDFGNQLY